jgi:transcription antitermination factor NusG
MDVPEEQNNGSEAVLAEVSERFDVPDVPVPNEDEKWFIAHTRPRCEKKLQSLCDERGFKCYLPLRRRVLTYGNRRRESFSPLFSGYIFCIAPENRKTFFRQNQYVANVLDVFDQEGLDKLLRDVHKAVDMGEELEVLPFIKKGQPVRVLSGPFKGQTCEVIDAAGGTRIVINIELIQQSVTFEIDAAMLGPV